MGIDVWNVDINYVNTKNIMLRVGGLLTVYGDLDFYGTSADFEDASEVIKVLLQIKIMASH